MQSIAERLTEKTPLILDGAMGTELFRRGVETRLPCWSAYALLQQPDLVRTVHGDYVRAGAEILTTNTFRTSARSLQKAGLGHLAKSMTQLAVRLAKEARENSPDEQIWVAGSVAPLEDCYEPKLVPDLTTASKEHAQMIEWLLEPGVDFLLIETMNTIEEAVVAAKIAAATGIPFFVSWVCNSDGNILSGQSLRDAVEALEPYRPSAFLVNCTPAVHLTRALSNLLKSEKSIPVGAYANIGKPEPVFGWEFTNEIDIDAYSDFACDWIGSGAKIVGGCCGTTPDHIHAIKAKLG
jgi:enediyne biosynthesis protein CalE2